jgi:hypothetical protein
MVEVKVHAFLISSALDAGEWSASCSGRFNSCKYLIGVWVDITSGIGVERKYSLSYLKLGPYRAAHRHKYIYKSRHQMTCFKATEKLHPPYRAALSEQNSVASSFATLPVASCLHSSELRCSCCNVVRFFCDLEAHNSVTATKERSQRLLRVSSHIHLVVDRTCGPMNLHLHHLHTP